MEMGLPMSLSVSNTLLKNIFGFLNKLAMQIDSVSVNSAHRIVLSKNVIRGLLIVLVHHLAMSFAFFGEFMRGRSIPSFICLMCLPG